MAFDIGKTISDSINNTVNKIKGIDTTATSVSDFGVWYSKTGDNPKLWAVKGEDWYKVYSYQFVARFVEEGDVTEFYYTLPLPPQQYSINPIMATKVTPTVGGVVEETSQILFWMINISGTPGIATARALKDMTARQNMAKSFRDNITTTGLLSGISAAANQAIAKIGGVVDTISDTVDAVSNSGNALEAAGAIAGGVTGALNTALTPPLPYSGSAVNAEHNGFVEMQDMVKFFYMYNYLKGQNPKKWSLYFIDYKNSQKWRIVIKDMSIQKNAQQPFLWKYSVSLQGWDVTYPTSVAKNKAEFNRFGPGGDLKSVNSMTFKSMMNIGDELFPGNGLTGKGANFAQSKL